MCLELLPKPRIQSQSRPVVCFKVLRRDGRINKPRWLAPYRDMVYRSGETKRVKQFGGSPAKSPSRQKPFTNKWPCEMRSVNRGLRAYQTLDAARRGIYYGGKIIVRCLIPAKTPFIRGKRGHIVALALQVDKAIYGKKALCAEFNSRKRQRA